jgi:anaerobic magnesium-protoporphyrin IX monomethyl ester cyclase
VITTTDIELVFPPQWEFSCPHLAIPSLAGYLTELGFSVHQWDANLWFIYTIMSEEYLKGVIETLSTKEFENDDALQQKMKFYLSISDVIISQTRKIFEKNVRGEGLRDTDMGYLKLAFQFVSSVFSPTRLSMYSCRIPFSVQSVESILDSTKDPLTNPFYTLFEEKFIPQLLGTDPAVVGISVTATTQLIPAVTLAALLKERAPHIHITLGGNTLSRFADEPERFRKLFDVIDSIVLFDGEPSLEVLLDRLESGRSLEDVPNLVTFSHGNVHRSPSTVFADVNMLPTPTFEGLDLHQYFFPEPVLPLLASRGCYWHRCAFCAIPHGYGKTYRARAIERVVEDMEQLSTTYKTNVFHFSDESIAPGQLNNLCDTILHRDLNFLWMAFARTEQGFTPELCKKLYRAGCRMLAFGLESGCQRILHLMNKGITTKRASDVLKNCAEAGILINLFVMFGFPTETRKEAQETMEFVLKHKDAVSSISDSVFELDYQSLVYCDPERYGVTHIYHPVNSELALAFDYDVAEGMNQEEVQKAHDEFQEHIVKKVFAKYGEVFLKGFSVPLLDDYEKSGEEPHVSE